MAQRKLLTNGSAFLRTDGRWAGVVWYMDEHGERKRKSFSGTTKAEVNKKMTDYVAAFDKMVVESDESKKTLEESMGNWLRVFKFQAIERGSYDRLECTAKHQIYPILGGKVVGDVTSADIRKLKSSSSKREVPLNQAAVDAILDLRNERYFGENAPLIPDEHGGYTRPVNFRRRYYRILKAAGIEQKSLHSIRHTFATTLVNGVKQENGSIKSLSPRQVADLLGHSTSEITELYYVKKDTSRLAGITMGFEL